MSVLEDVSTRAGEALRVISGGLWCGDAKRLFTSIQDHELMRMDEIDYNVESANFPSEFLTYTNHYWLTEGGKYSWGLPSGTLRSHAARLLKYKGDWNGQKWDPDKARCTSEGRARDMLLASYLFPFRAKEKTAELAHKYGSMAVLKHARKSGLVAGSKAVMSIIEKAGRDPALGNEMSALMEDKGEKNLAWWNDFNRWSTYLSVGTSCNSLDAGHAAHKVQQSDKGMTERGLRFLAIARLVNHCEKAMRLASRRGSIGRSYSELHREVACLEDGKGISQIKDSIAEEDIERVLKEPYEQLTGNKTKFKRCHVYRIKDCAGIRILPARDIVYVYFKQSKKIFVLTQEDLKSLKFCSMSHSMWWIYAASAAIEDIRSAPMKNEVEDDKIPEDLQGHLDKVYELMMHIQGRLGMPNKQVGQQVIKFEKYKSKICGMWDLYERLMRESISRGNTDILGRYLSELFSVYTALIGGHLAKAGHEAAVVDVTEEYTRYGFNPSQDIAQLLSCFKGTPMSVIQDFGRLAKIAPPYDVNPIYSYIDRVKKMNSPNPIGKPVFIDDNTYELEQFSDEEDRLREVEYKSACRVMLTIADIKRNTVRMLTAEDKVDLDASNWIDIVDYCVKHSKRVRGTVELLDEPVYPVPNAEREEALSQAAELLREGRQPVNIFAGAYLGVENTMAYLERGSPDLAILKATSVSAASLGIVFSTRSRLKRSTPTSDVDGRRPVVGGDMITEYLTGRFPTRKEAISFTASEITVATTSDKVETSKYIYKTRIITSLAAAGRRVQGEFEYNNGRNLKDVPGFSVGADPAAIRKQMYASIRDDIPPGFARLFISLDLSSFSTGMHWDIQSWTNNVLEAAYDGGRDNFRVLDRATKGSSMVRSEAGIKLYSNNSLGANYEGVDGKRNTFMHCVLWYMARANAAKAGIEGAMRSLIFIDDGAANIEVPARELEKSAKLLKACMVTIYAKYGFKLSLLKTVVSETYVQFLNEIYHQGVHVGYGFRALCHTAAQSFPPLATVSEELAVITGGIRGAAYSGGHPLRLMIGMHYVLFLYIHGVIGSKGMSLRKDMAGATALCLSIPTAAGGFGLPNVVQIFSNLSGHRDVEKFSKLPLIVRLISRMSSEAASLVKSYMKGKLMMSASVDKKQTANRLTIVHPAVSEIGPRNRSLKIANAALRVTTDLNAKLVIQSYLSNQSSLGKGTFARAFLSYCRNMETPLPVALVEKALDTDPTKATALLVDKIASSRMVHKLLTGRDIRKFNVKYYQDARKRINEFACCMKG